MKTIRYFSFFSIFFQHPLAHHPPPLPHSLLQKHLGAGAAQSFCWDQGCSFLLGVRYRAQILSPSLKAPWPALLPHYRLLLDWLKREIVLHVNLSPFFFLCNRAIILIDHHKYAEQALRACSGKNINPDREALTDNIEQTSKVNEVPAGHTTTLLLGCWNLLFKYTV